MPKSLPKTEPVAQAHGLQAQVGLTLTLALGSLIFCTRGQAQELTFDVVSLKPSSPGVLANWGSGRLEAGNQTYSNHNAPLRALMVFAYSIPERQISGGPAWMDIDQFDIDAHAARPVTIDEVRLMLQHLLEDRFQLKIRRESREQAVWNMVVDKEGATMPVHDPAHRDDPPLIGPQIITGHGSACPGLIASNMSMNYLAFVLSRNLDRNVIDKTGLDQRYDVDLQFAPDPANHLPDDAGPSIGLNCPDIATAMRDQLGLRLEPAKGLAAFLVVEHAEKPAPR